MSRGWRLGRKDGGLWDGPFGRCRPKRHSGIGNRILRFSVFWGGFRDSRFPMGRRESGIGKRAVSDSAATGNRVPGAASGDFLVWWEGHLKSAAA
jgi:hypothetical protein